MDLGCFCQIRVRDYFLRLTQRAVLVGLQDPLPPGYLVPCGLVGPPLEAEVELWPFFAFLCRKMTKFLNPKYTLAWVGRPSPSPVFENPCFGYQLAAGNRWATPQAQLGAVCWLA